MFFKVRFTETPFEEDERENTYSYVKTFEADSEQQLKEKISIYIAEITDSFMKVEEINEVSAQDVIAEVKQELFDEIFNRYLRAKLKPRKLDAQQYAELKNNFLNDPSCLYAMLQYEIKTLRVEEYLGRYNPHFSKTMSDISAKQFFDRVAMLSEGDPDSIGN